MEHPIDSIERCTICFNPMTYETMCTTNCNHSYCKPCLDTWFNRGEKTCPICRTDIEYLLYKSENIRIIFNRLIENDNTNTNNTNTNNARMLLIIRSNNLLKKYIYLACAIISFQIYISINNSNNIYNCMNELEICNINNTNLRNEINIYNNNEMSEIDVYNTYRNIISTCSFPIYYIHQCFTN